MQCPKCKIDAFIEKKDILFKGDTSPDTQTQAFYRLHFYCRNPTCADCGKEIGTEEIELS